MRGETTDWLGGGFLFALLVFVVSYLIAGGVYSDGGRTASDGDHYEALPAQVVQLTPKDYLVKGSLVPASLCFGTDGNDGSRPVETEVNVPSLPGQFFVVCNIDQRWSDHERKSIDFGQGLGRIIQRPMFFVAEGGMVFLCMLPGLWMLQDDLRTERKRKKVAKKQVVLDAEQKRRELRAAYANGEITEAAFERGINEVYKLGVKPAKE